MCWLGCPQRKWESCCLCGETEARAWSWGLSTWQCWGEEQGLNTYLWVISVLRLSSSLLIPSSPQEISHREQSLNESLSIKWFWIEEVPRHYFFQNHSWWLSANDMKRDSISICLILKVLADCLWISWEWSSFCFLSARVDTKKDHLGRRVFSLVSYRNEAKKGSQSARSCPNNSKPTD